MLRAELTVPEAFRCVTRSLMDVVPRAMSWVWQGWIPRGSLSLVLGEPGVGKSLYGLQLAAMVTRGWPTVPISVEWQDERQEIAEQGGANATGQLNGQDRTSRSSSDGLNSPGFGRAPDGAGFPGTVVLFEPGDGVSLLRARLDAAGADVEQVVLVERNWRGESPDDVEEFFQTEPRQPTKRSSRVDKDRELQRDLESLEHHIVQLRQSGREVSLVIIDPIESLLRDSIDPHRLARSLNELADRLDVAIVAVGTTSLTPRAYPGLRLDGKGIDALFKMSKTVMTVARDLENELQRMVLPTKVTLSAVPPGLTFAFDEDGRIEWSQTPPCPEGDVVDEPRERRKPSAECAAPQDGSGKELNRAKQWLKEQLSEGGVPVTTLRSHAREHEISKATLRRAYVQLGCISKKSWGSSTGQWVWHLPEPIASEQSEFTNEIPTDALNQTESWERTEPVKEACAASAT